MLGGSVPFNYCRSMNTKLPCQRLGPCWQRKLNVEKFLEENYSTEELEKAFTKDPRNRIQKIVELAEKSRKKE